MALVIADRVKETSTTAGTGTVVLAGASAGYQSFAVIGNGNTTFYTIADQGGGTNWEVGIGTYYSGNLSLARTTILASSNSNTAVSFGSNTKDVFVTYPAEYAIYNNTASITTIQNLVSSNVAITGGSINNVLIGNATANSATFTSLTASSNITTTGYTGYLYGNNSAVVTASTTIPSSAITGLGTMASQNANNVNITGGTISGTGISSSNVTITGGSIDNTQIGASTANTGAFTTLSASGLTSLNNTAVISANSSSDALRITQVGSGNALLVEDSSNPDSTPFVIDASGNVGIGNTSPSSKLDVTGTVWARANGTSYDARTGFVNTKTDDDSYLTVGYKSTPNAFAISASYVSTGAYLPITFATSSTERIRITASGNVGIGNTSPPSKLTVAGVIQSTTGGVTFPDGTTQTTAATSGLSGLSNNSIVALNVNLTANATINAGVNGFSVGPVNTANGVTITITSGQRWVII